MNVTVGIPWRAGDPWRERSLEYVLDHLATTGLPVELADSGHDPFNRAASRNLLADLDADVVIFHDADMLAPADAYREMAGLALATGRMVVGYTEYRALSRSSTVAVLDEGHSPWSAQPAGTTRAWSVGGIIALTPDAWRTAGGMDERFVGWGCEDFALANAAALTLGELLRTPNPAVHLWHPHGADRPAPGQEANSDLLAAYGAATTVEELRAVQGGAPS